MNEQTKQLLRNYRQNDGDDKTFDDDTINRRNISPILLTANEAAQLLGFTRQFFYQLQASGRLGPHPFYFGKRTRWSLFELHSWVCSGCPPRDRWLIIKEAENTPA